jgi:hypothetical protein
MVKNWINAARLGVLPCAAAVLIWACGSDSEPAGTGAGGNAHNGNAGNNGGEDSPMFGSGSGDGGPTGPTGNAGSAGQEQEDGSCGGTTLMGSQIPINLLVVLDRSGSMDSTPDGFAVNKWDAIRDALGGALEARQDRLTVGLEVYPHDPNDEIPLNCDPDVCCTTPSDFSEAIVVPLATGEDAVPTIVSTLQAMGPGGGTPTAAALSLALDYFDSADAQVLEGERFVLLATDGGPNCNADNTCDAETCTANIDNNLPFTMNQCDPSATGPSFCLDSENTVAAAEALAAAGIKTIVVGIPGSEAYADVLDAVAIAGGAPNTTGDDDYYAVTAEGGVAGLENTLRDVTTELIRSCELQLESTPPDPRLVNVKIDGEFIPYFIIDDSEPDAGEVDGWTLDETTAPPTVVLHGTPCDSMLENGAENVEVLFGCPRVEIIR